MQNRNLKIKAAALAAAVATGTIGMVHQSYPPSWRFYLAMPGLFIGLLLGFSVDSQMLVIPAAIGANALVYYGIARGLLSLTRRKGAD